MSPKIKMSDIHDERDDDIIELSDGSLTLLPFSSNPIPIPFANTNYAIINSKLKSGRDFRPLFMMPQINFPSMYTA